MKDVQLSMSIIFCSEFIHLLVCIPSNVYNFIRLQFTVSAFVIFASLHHTLFLGSVAGKCGRPSQSDTLQQAMTLYLTA